VGVCEGVLLRNGRVVAECAGDITPHDGNLPSIPAGNKITSIGWKRTGSLNVRRDPWGFVYGYFC